MLLRSFFKNPQVKKWLAKWTSSTEMEEKDNPRVMFRINVKRRSVPPFWTHWTRNWQTPLLKNFNIAKRTNLSKSDGFREEAPDSSNFKVLTEKNFETSNPFLALMAHVHKLRVVALETGKTFKTGSSVASERPKRAPLKFSDLKVFCGEKSAIKINQEDISPEEVRIKFLNAFGLVSYPSKNSPAMCRRASKPGWGFLMTKPVVLNQMWVSFTVDISFYLKLMPNITDIMQIAEGVNENGANGVTVNMISSESDEIALQFYLGASLVQVRFSMLNQNDSVISDYCPQLRTLLWDGELWDDQSSPRPVHQRDKLIVSGDPPYFGGKSWKLAMQEYISVECETQVAEAQSFSKEQEHQTGSSNCIPIILASLNPCPIIN